ncbi:MAG: hypothetical protein A2Y21_07695 [Clostridiales bacterium GWC2_40_7]|nr:MAG: hypothetical protein A2Y21_07695 [Clostridiales bacterium GWC2_40_7]
MPELNQQIASDLPLEYEQDCINLLVRDPHWVYVYWDISKSRKDLLVREFGNEFMSKSVPVLKITNISKNQSFFVRINEFSTDWYVNVADTNCIYVAEIGRKVTDNFFISILNSNSVLTPGDSVSNDSFAYFVDYNHLKQGRLDLGKIRLLGSQIQNQSFAGYFGISSLELTGNSENERHFGESSAQFYGV